MLVTLNRLNTSAMASMRMRPTANGRDTRRSSELKRVVEARALRDERQPLAVDPATGIEVRG